MIGIEFGGGDHPRRPHFDQCEVRPLPGVLYCCEAWEINQHVAKDSVNEIYSRHFFEHLTFAQGRETLMAWHQILAPGGRVEMWIPDMDFHVQQWCHARDLAHARAGFWGWQRQDGHGHWDLHKSGYNQQHLGELVTELGYIGYQRLNGMNRRHLAVEFFKN